MSSAADRQPTEAGPGPPEGAQTVVWVRGEQDLSTEAELWQTITSSIDGATADVVVDLSEVEFLGVATVGVFLRAAELLRQNSHSLRIRHPSKRALRVLDLCGLTDLVESTS